ncbi:MAG: lipopolysaccharide assembly protein LapA domain-containing protein [Bacteroidota bacterium]
MRLALVVVFLAAVVFILLATQEANTATWIPLDLPFSNQTISSPLIGWIGGSFGIGLLLGYLAALPGRFGAARTAKKAQKELAKVEASRSEAASARAAAASSRTGAPTSSSDAAEMQQLADKVAARTEATVKRDA